MHAKPWTALLLALTLLGPGRLEAGSASAQPTPARLELGPADYGWAAAVAGLGAWGQSRYFGMDPADPAEHSRADLWPFDRWAAGNYSEAAALASDILIYPLVAAPMAVSALDARRAGGWKLFLTEAVVYSEAMILSSSLALLVRSTQVHPRPLIYGSDAPEEQLKKGEASGSFYSGHANGSFAAATYLAYTYPRLHPEFRHGAWLWAGALGWAATVASLRVAAGKHFPSDIVVGAAAGACFGWLLPRLHWADEDGGGAELRLLPVKEGAQALLAYRF